MASLRLSLLLFTLSFFTHAVIAWLVKCFIHSKGDTQSASSPHAALVDVIHSMFAFDRLPKQSQKACILSREVLTIGAIGGYVYCVWRYGGPMTDFASQILCALALMLFLKSVTCAVTILPPPNTDPECNCDFNIAHLIRGTKCGDLVFSAHTASVLIFGLVAAQYFSSLRWVVWVVAGLVGFAMVVTRAHYTVDVVLALLVGHVVTRSRLCCN